MKIIHLDPTLLGRRDDNKLTEPDPEVVRAVRRALEGIPHMRREIIEARFNRGMTFAQIAGELKMPLKNVLAEYYAAIRMVRYRLAPFVAERWRVTASGLCRICCHPRRSEIEAMLLSKAERETWGMFGDRLERAIGERINPPRILIAHLKHMGDDDGTVTRDR